MLWFFWDSTSMDLKSWFHHHLVSFCNKSWNFKTFWLVLHRNVHNPTLFSYSSRNLLEFWQVCCRPFHSLVSFTQAMKNIISFMLSVTTFLLRRQLNELEFHEGGKRKTIVCLLTRDSYLCKDGTASEILDFNEYEACLKAFSPSP